MVSFSDNFDDGNHTGWTVIQGSWTATNGYLEDQSGTEYKEIERDSPTFDASKNLNAEWDVRFDSGDQFQFSTFRVIYLDDNNRVQVRMDENDSLSLSVYDAGTKVAEVNPGWTHDLNFHTVRVEHRSGTWELFFDGTSQGTDTASVSFTGPTNILNQSWSNGTDDTYDFDNIVVEGPPSAPSGLTATASGDDITPTWTDNSGDETGFPVYRATASGVTKSDYTRIDTAAANATSYQDLNLSDGEKFYYRVSAENAPGESALSNEDSATTALPAPTLDSVTVISSTELDVAWTPNDDNADTYDIEVSTDGGTSWSVAGTAAGSATQTTVSGLRTGEFYDTRAVAVTEHVRSPSNSIGITTDFAAITGLAGDASVEDEVTITWDDTANYGSYRVQHRVTDSGNSYTDEGTVTEATTSKTITGLSDGEQYDIRVRHETEHGSGAWTEIAPVTLLPTVSSLTVDATTVTTADLSWTGEADNEDGYKVLREREYDYGWGPQTELADLAPGSTSFSQSDLSPGNTYRWTVRVYTEHVTADTTVQGTTTSSGKPRKPVRSQGWFAEVGHPDSGAVHRPTVLDGATQIQPTVNGLPRVEIAVPRNAKWQAEAFEDHPRMEVWKGGERQPVDTLVDVRTETGGTTDRNVLVAEGGRELKQTVTKEKQQADTHTVAKEVIEEVGYTANVDAPTQTVRENELVQDADTQSEFQNHSTLADTDAFERTADGRFAPLQACQTQRSTENDAQSGAGIVNDDVYTGGQALWLGSQGDSLAWDFVWPYDLPEDRVGIAVRDDEAGDTGELADFTWSLDGQTLTSPDTLSGLTLGWQELDGSGFYGGSGWTGGTLQAGTTYRLEVEIDAAEDDGYIPDVVALYDKAFLDVGEFPNTLDEPGGHLPGPKDYPQMAVEFDDFQTGQSVSGGRIEATMLDGQTLAEVALSNDQGASWSESADTNTYEVDFAQGGATLRWRATFEGYGSRDDDTPTQGFQRQELDAYELFADIDETPLTIGWSRDDHAEVLLNELAGEDYVWAVRLVDGEWTVDWTQPGQRVADAEPDPASYTISKSTADVYQKVTVIGSPRDEQNDPFAADHGTPVGLSHEHLVDGSEIVYNPVDGTTYEPRVDYEMSNLTGQVTTLASGSISDGENLQADYRFEVRGSYQLDTVSDPLEAPKATISGLTSERACEQAAIAILNEVSKSLYTASVSIPTDEIGWHVVEALDVPGMPSDGPLEQQNLSAEPGEISGELGSRATFGRAVKQLRDQVSQVSRRS